MNRLVTFLALGGATILDPGALLTQEASIVYDRYSRAVAKVEVLEARTGAPSSVGTAFFAAPSLLLTNYHVVRDLVFEPGAYRLRLVPVDGTDPGTIRIVTVDPANDLAVLRVDRVHPSPLKLADDWIPNGETLYSIGHPADLRTSVVEGVFNGEVEYAAAPRLHFSGSLNPGMSGGPTLRANGEVVGINVSTAGNQLSFLVPAAEGRKALEAASAIDSISPADLRTEAGNRLMAFQDRFFSRLVDEGLPHTTMGQAILPAGPNTMVNCSADPHEVEEDRYELTEYRCYTEDQMLVGPDGSYDLIYIEHLYMTSKTISRLAFQALASYWYQTVTEWEAPPNKGATAFRCRRGNVREGLAAKVLVAFCTRRHRFHPGLYDLYVRSALLGKGNETVVSTLRASPISFDKATSLTEHWLKGFAWTN